MRKLISGLIGSIWGAVMLVHWGILKGAENLNGVALGAVLFIAGIYYLIQWKKTKS